MPNHKTTLTHHSAGQAVNKYILELRQRIALHPEVASNPTAKNARYYVERLAALEQTAIELTLGLQEVTEYALHFGVKGIEADGLVPSYSFTPTTMTTNAARRALKLTSSPKAVSRKQNVA